jgi:hypothetical protein
VKCLQQFAVIAVFILSLSALLFSQGGATGAISGTLQDAHGRVLAGAKVSVVSEATGQAIRQLKSDNAGLFNALLLPVGTYSIEVSAEGFALTKIDGVVVRITETTRLTAVLKLSAVKEEVEVHSEVAPLDTSDATTGESISTTTITSLPLATRNFQQLLDLSAGASSDLNSAAALGRGVVRINVNGGREDNNNYLIEGISASDYAFGELTFTPVPNPDSIQEFKVGTSLYDATQGRNGGGNINAIFKSGAARFHGALWEYFRNSSLDAKDYFLGDIGIKQNIYGGDFGGPIGAKAKLGFFYLNYQGTRQRSADSPGTYISDAQVPVLPSVRSCQNLVSTFFPGGLPSYIKVNPNNTTCGLDPVAVNLLSAKGNQFGASPGGYLIPTVAGTPGNLDGTLTLTNPGWYNDDQFTANWDREFNHGKDHVSERFFWSDAETYEPFGADNLQTQTGLPPSPGNLNFPLAIPLRGRFGSIAETHAFTTALLNEFRFGVNVISDSLQNVPVPGASASELGIKNGSGAPDMYRFQFGNGLQIGPFPNQLQSALSDSLVWLDTVSWTHGPHALRFGGEVDRTSIRRNLPVLDNGLLYFTPGADATLNYFQNFLLGEPAFGEGGGGAANHDYHIPGFAVFVQDDYRVTSNLTLNLGLRTEWVGAAYDKLCHLGNANPQNANTMGDPFVYPSCVSQYNTPGFSGTLNKAALNSEFATVLEPRIGFAYNLPGDPSTVVRGGYGIYSVREDIGGVDNLSFTAPFYPVLVVGGSPGTMASLFAGTPPLGKVDTSFLPTPSFFQGFAGGDTTGGPMFSGTAINYISLSVPLHWIVPTTQQWNFGIQHQLGGNWVAELGYVGTKGTHLRSTFDPDQPALASASNPITLTCGNSTAPCLTAATGTKYTITQNTIANSSARAPYLGIAPAAYEAFYPNSDSHYNALQASLSHHFAKGLYLQSAYTWSKSIDDVSTASVAFLTRVNDQNNARASRGLSDFDHRHRLVTSFNYALPFLNNRQDLAGHVLGGWEAGGVIILQSGEPITILDGNGGSTYQLASPVSTANFAPGYGCHNALNSGSLATRLANWVNPSAYRPAPVVGSDGSTGFGDSPRNCIIGPGQSNIDFTLAKTFKLGENQNVLFRTEFFNLFNHPSFANPSSTANVAAGSAIGEINQTVGTPRLIQFSLKYLF